MIGIKFHHRQTAAIHRNAVAQLDFARNALGVRETHPQPPAMLAALERLNFCDGFRDSRKHRENILPPRSPVQSGSISNLSVRAILRTSAARSAPRALRCP